MKVASGKIIMIKKMDAFFYNVVLDGCIWNRAPPFLLRIAKPKHHQDPYQVETYGIKTTSDVDQIIKE